jgi:hypothetical protein
LTVWEFNYPKYPILGYFVKHLIGVLLNAEYRMPCASKKASMPFGTEALYSQKDR